MIKGKTRTGFEYHIEDTAPDNMELIDAIADSGDDPTQISKIIKLLLGKEQRDKLYEHLRTEDGRVPLEATMSEIQDMFNGENEKNS